MGGGEKQTREEMRGFGKRVFLRQAGEELPTPGGPRKHEKKEVPFLLEEGGNKRIARYPVVEGRRKQNSHVTERWRNENKNKKERRNEEGRVQERNPPVRRRRRRIERRHEKVCGNVRPRRGEMADVYESLSIILWTCTT